MTNSGWNTRRRFVRDWSENVPINLFTLSTLHGAMPRKRESVGKALRRALGEEVVIPKIEPRKPGVSQLMNERRLRIYQEIFNEPGVHLRELQRRLEIPLQSLRWHISLLLKSGLLECVSYGKKKLLFSPISAHRSKILAKAIFRDARLRPYIDALRCKEEASVSELVESLNSYQQLVSATLESLRSAGFVEQVGEGRRKRFKLALQARNEEDKADMAEVREKLVQLLTDQGLAPRVRLQTSSRLSIIVNKGMEDIELVFKV